MKESKQIENEEKKMPKKVQIKNVFRDKRKMRKES